MTKKLANTKGFPLVMMILAFLFSAAAAAQEFISMLAYKIAFSKDEYRDILIHKTSEFFSVYGTACFLFLFTFFVMLVFIAGAGKKSCGYKEGLIVLFAGISAAVAPLFRFLFLAGSDDFKNMSEMADDELFLFVSEIIVCLAPVLIGLFLALAGLGLVIKVKASGTAATLPEQTAAQKQADAQKQTAQPTAESRQQIPAEAVQAVTEVLEVPKPAEEEVKAEGGTYRCKNCGGELAVGAKFCRHCGSKQD